MFEFITLLFEKVQKEFCLPEKANYMLTEIYTLIFPCTSLAGSHVYIAEVQLFNDFESHWTSKVYHEKYIEWCLTDTQILYKKSHLKIFYILFHTCKQSFLKVIII